MIWAQHAAAFERGLVPEPVPSYVAGYKQWQGLGRQVLKGQPGYQIIAPVTGRFASAHPQDADSWPAEHVPVRQWVSVVFLQGEDADEVLGMIDGDGVDAAMTYLKNWDYGEETTDAALENGHVYDFPPAGMLDREARDGDYQMTYSHSFGHVGLYRLHTIEPGDVLDDEPRRPAIARADATRSVPAGSWFEHPGIAAVKHARGLGL